MEPSSDQPVPNSNGGYQAPTPPPSEQPSVSAQQPMTPPHPYQAPETLIQPTVISPSAPMASTPPPTPPAPQPWTPTSAAAAVPPAFPEPTASVPVTPTVSSDPYTSAAASTFQATPTPQPTVTPNSPAPSPFAAGPMPAFMTAPDQQPAVTGSGGLGYAPVQSSRKPGRKTLLLGGIVAGVLLLGGGGVFGLYLPHTPSNVFKTGVGRTGKAVNAIISDGTDQKKLASLGTSTIDGSVSATVDGGKYSGSFNTTFDKMNLTGGLKLNLQDSTTGNTQLSAQVVSELAKGSNYPDIYFEVTGLQSLGLDNYVPGLTNYDGKWIVVDSKYLQSVGDDYLKGSDNNDKQLTTSDIAETARVAAQVTQQYVFSTDKDKAVLEERSFVGKETVDGIKTNHYKVGINKAHVTDYCTALTRAELATDAYKKLSGDSSSEISTDQKNAAKNCQSSTKDISTSASFDMWIGGKYTLIHKIRVYDQDNKGSYTDIAQNFDGKNELALSVTSHDPQDKVEGNLTFDTNLKTNESNATLTITGTDSSDPYSVKAILNAKASSQAVKVTTPSNAIPIQTVLNALGLNSDGSSTATSPSSSGSSLDEQAKDTERQTDIDDLQTQLEAFYANDDFYPTLAELNSSSWRQTNMTDFDDSSLKDPDGNSATLSATNAKGQYGYQPSDCTPDGDCDSYTLSATLSDGSLYAQTSLD